MFISISAVESKDSKNPPSPNGARLRKASFYSERKKKLESEIAEIIAKKKRLSKNLIKYRWLHSLVERKDHLNAQYRAAVKKHDQSTMDKLHRQIKRFMAKNESDLKKAHAMGKYLEIVPKTRRYMAKKELEQKSLKRRLELVKSKLAARLEYDKRKAKAVTKPTKKTNVHPKGTKK